MEQKNNPLEATELTTEQSTNMIDGIRNNTPIIPPMPVPTVKTLDKVKPPTRKSRTWERER